MNLKKKIGAFFLAAATVLSCGCGNRETAAGVDISVFVYDSCQNVHLMAAEGDVLYTLTAGEEDKAVLSAYDLGGKQIAQTLFPEIECYSINAFCAYNDKIYAAVYKTNKIYNLCALDPDSGSADIVCELGKLDQAEKTAVKDGKLYWIGSLQKDAKNIEPFEDREGNMIYFQDSGKKMGCIDLESGENTLLDLEFPVSFALSADGVTVYAFDTQGGYYFADLSDLSKKQYTGKLRSINNFEYYGGDDFAFVGGFDYSGALPVSRADSGSGIAAVAQGVYNAYTARDLCASSKGHVWVKASDSAESTDTRIRRYDMSGFVLSGDPVRVISCEYYEDLPFAAGREIKAEQLSGEGFALTVLSLDKSYDIAAVNSSETFAAELKENGSFYPLNDVKGVEEYLDSCFPYIKEAVTDGDGNICMLPVRVVIPLMAYREGNCAENGIAFSSDPAEFIETVRGAAELSGYRYGCMGYWLKETLLAGYLSREKSFDTEQFRSLAVLLKERCTKDIFVSDVEMNSAAVTLPYVQVQYYQAVFDKMLFNHLRYHSEEMNFLNFSKGNDLRAAAMPLPESGKSVAICTFLCVNPYSDRLSETLAYIEDIAAALSEERNSCMLADISTYDDTAFARDLYSVYENGEIYFQIPSEIYSEDFDRYCDGKMTLDEFIAEADRKLSAYLNE